MDQDTDSTGNPIALQRTPLYLAHVDAGAKLVDFGGWEMPIHYGSQVEEHHLVRSSAGMFDVSHMTVVDVSGTSAAVATAYLQHLLANDVDRLAPQQALYSAMLNDEGGVIDDLIVYRLEGGYRLVVNCATRAKDLAWMQKQAEGFEVEIKEQAHLAMIAVQGPEARERVSRVLSSPDLMELKTFYAMSLESKPDWLIARTGYTGEDGFEIMLPEDQANEFWSALLEADVQPAGLGARDTLRLEAGMNLYGSDMDDTVSPLACNMAWTIAWEPAGRGFVGRSVLEGLRAQNTKQVGLVMEQRGVLRGHQPVLRNGEVVGEITSGTFSPTLGHAIALARIDFSAEDKERVVSDQYEVEIRNKRCPVQLVRAPFVRNAKKVFKAI